MSYAENGYIYLVMINDKPEILVKSMDQAKAVMAGWLAAGGDKDALFLVVYISKHTRPTYPLISVENLWKFTVIDDGSLKEVSYPDASYPMLWAYLLETWDDIVRDNNKRQSKDYSYLLIHPTGRERPERFTRPSEQLVESEWTFDWGIDEDSDKLNLRIDLLPEEGSNHCQISYPLHLSNVRMVGIDAMGIFIADAIDQLFTYFDDPINGFTLGPFEF